MTDFTFGMRPTINNLTMDNNEIRDGQPRRFEDVLGSYSPGRHLTCVKDSKSIVLQWHEVLLAAIRQSAIAPTVCARALYIVQVAVYDAWAVYTAQAEGVHWSTSGLTRQSPTARLSALANTEQASKDESTAIAFAAYTSASALFPKAVEAFGIFMAQVGLIDAAGTVMSVKGSNDKTSPAGVGTAAGEGVIAARLNDGSNQSNAYMDTSNYMAKNDPFPVYWRDVPVDDPNAWQPLMVEGEPPQMPATPHWGGVAEFAELPKVPPAFPQFQGADQTSLYRIQADEVLGFSAALSSDKNKVIADYWADYRNSNMPPGHWSVFAVWLSYTREYTIAQDVQLLFAVTAAMFDASIICWRTKYIYNTPRPITAVNAIYGKNLVTAYRFGVPRPGETQVTALPGCEWRPYQPNYLVSPPFPAYISGHSTFGAAAAQILKDFSGSDIFDLSVTVPKNSLPSDASYNTSFPNPLAPVADVTLFWRTFSEASDENGISRLYNGVHYQRDNSYGMETGRAVGTTVWCKVVKLLGSDLKNASYKPRPAPGQGPCAEAPPPPKRGGVQNGGRSSLTQ